MAKRFLHDFLKAKIIYTHHFYPRTMAPNDPVITFETLYDIMKREKAHEELQKLNPNFYQDVSCYIKDKQKILESQSGKDSIFASQEIEKTRMQLKNILKIVRDLYDRREAKITQLALLCSRNKDRIYDTTALLHEEMDLLNRMREVAESARDGFFSMSVKESGKPKDLKIKAETDTGCRVRMVCNVPEFLGIDLKTYGPYANEAVISLPFEVADMLVSTGQATKENENT